MRWTKRKPGLKSALAVKVFGTDLNVLATKRARQIKHILEGVRGITDVTLVQELGQPSLTIKVDRAKIARYGLNVDDVNDLINTAIGGDVATQVVQGEKEFDLVVRLEQQYRDNPKRSATSRWRLQPASRFRSRSWPIFR